MSDPSLSEARRIDQVCNRFEQAWKAGRRPRIDDYLPEVPEPEQPALFRDLLGLEIQYRRLHSDTLDVKDFLRRFPAYANLIQAILVEEGVLGGGGSPVAGEPPPGPPASAGDETRPPERLGRYRITAQLGAGAFGIVYKAYDDDLQRDVAIKVPHRHRLASLADAEMYLKEARILAGLSHPGIVPAYDVGRTDDGLCYLVSKFIEGCDLRTRMKQARLACAESAALVAGVAEALHHAHQRGLVHRDIKPANILLDAAGQPVVADFGLALREAEFGTGPTFAGTPAYMSPEQARGEGHRVDARTDVYSLGVVFFELLTGQRPFPGEPTAALLQRIKTQEPRPPRQVDDAIPKELDRICLKCLAKRAADRYSTARDLADDLRHWLAAENTPPPVQVQVSHQPAINVQVLPPAPAEASASLSTSRSEIDTDQRAVKMVPKGLRSFDAQDADFFLELLPGPRDRHGLPESLRFWKTRIEATDPDQTFGVGLLYGPSGCGKSSLVKAGLLPRLASPVIAVYVEATAADTEARLLKGLRKNGPDLPADLGLIETLAAVQRGRGVPAGHKVLIVLDQFEQWLHAQQQETNTELVQALRQCDGERLQCLVLVRDDFWMAVTRFMAALEINLLQGQNLAAVDLFGLPHARKVLAAFGQAFGALPEPRAPAQEAFLDQAVAGLAREGKVISVRLALFAEMVKHRAWTPQTLKAVGGTTGVGVTFLEETFRSPAANPKHRLHEQAARAVLTALLPESGTDIKGRMRSRADLRAASGYAGRPRDFEELLRILDAELRLITPTDPEGAADDSRRTGSLACPPPRQEPPSESLARPEQYYQLTHDYLVPSLRDWLTRKQKETRRGRAELRLAERAALWNARPENRHLPAWWEWLNIRLLTRQKDWTPSQHQLMRKAARYHTVRGTILAMLLAFLAWTGWEVYHSQQADKLVEAIVTAETVDVPPLLQRLAPYRRWARARLERHLRESEQASKEHLHASLALLADDPGQVKYLSQRLLDAEPHEVVVLRDALHPFQDELRERLWAVVEQPDKPSQRLRAACALAAYDPANPRWDPVSRPVAEQLVSVNAAFLGPWLKAFRPIKPKLVAPLDGLFHDQHEERTAERRLAASLLVDYLADQPDRLAALIQDADEKQFAVLFPTLEAQREPVVAVLKATLATALEAQPTDAAKEQLAKRQANAAVALLKLGQAADVWPLLKHRPDPRVRSYLIHRFGPLGADVGALIQRLAEEPDVTIRRALLLSLGPEEFGADAWTPAGKTQLVEHLKEIYRTEADPGLRAAAEWLLRQWQEEAWLVQTDGEWAKDKEMRTKRLADIQERLAKEKAKAPAQWYVNSQGQTMVVLPGPVQVLMGSPPTEANRDLGEHQHQRRIRRTFAIAATAVTKDQFRRFLPHFSHSQIHRYPEPTCPIGGVTWYEAAAYCNWLSAQDGLPPEQWCYETNAQEVTSRQVQAYVAALLQPHPLAAAGCSSYFLRVRRPSVTKLKANYLSLTGYRLPTEAEWEYACRAGAVTSRYYGETEDLLPRYAWYLKNSGERTWPVGTKKPNDLGLFDMHGNVYTWCQERYQTYPEVEEGKAIEDKEDIKYIKDTDSRLLRGGSFNNPASLVRCAIRIRRAPATRLYDFGFRPARTFTAE